MDNVMGPNDRLSQAVEARLAADERTRDAVIEVSSAAGEITLRGAVASESAKEAADEVAKAAPGALLVINELVVSTADHPADADTTLRLPLIPSAGGYSGGGTTGPGRI